MNDMHSKDRSIAHMDLDAFFVSVECLRESSLKGKPLIIGGKSDRGVVASCSYEARSAGVHSAMPIRMAKRLCPDAIILRGDMEEYSKQSSLVTDVIASKAPLFEKASIDEFYLDLSGMDRYFGTYQWTIELRKEIIKETGLPISFGLSVNKLVAKVSTDEAKPNGQIQIEKGKETSFLHPLAVKKLPGVGLVTQRQLTQMGIQTIKTLSDLPKELLISTFGQHGASLWDKSHAIDNRPVIPYREQKSMSKESTLEKDTLRLDHIKAKIIAMTEQLAFELRNQKNLCGCIAIKIRYSDFNTYTKQKSITLTSLDRPLIQYALELFDQLYQQRKMIRLIGVRFSQLISGSPQINLFDSQPRDIALIEEMDLIRNRFGKTAIQRAGGIISKKPTNKR
jgi:DNA polymerase-4